MKPDEMKDWVDTVTIFRDCTENAYLKNLYQQMLDELEKGDLEMEKTPKYFSLLALGYDVFSYLHPV
jgi:hypothetical protein